MSLVSIALVGKDNEPLYLRDFSSSQDQDNNNDGDEKADDATDANDPFGFFTTKIFKESSSPLCFQECALRHQFILHASLDRFEEITSPSFPSSNNRNNNNNNESNKGVGNSSANNNRGWRTPGSSGNDAMWVGLLCPVDDFKVYGYLTTTSIKILAVMEDDESYFSQKFNQGGTAGVGSSSQHLQQMQTNMQISQQIRESELKVLFVSFSTDIILSFSTFYRYFPHLFCFKFFYTITQAKVHSLYVEYTLNPFTKIKAPIVSSRFDHGLQNLVHAFNNKKSNEKYG